MVNLLRRHYFASARVPDGDCLVKEMRMLLKMDAHKKREKKREIKRIKRIKKKKKLRKKREKGNAIKEKKKKGGRSYSSSFPLLRSENLRHSRAFVPFKY